MTIHKRPDDSGSTTVQYAVVMPLVLLLFMIVVQIGLWWYTRALVLTAAQQGLQAGRTVTGTTNDATAAARSFLLRAGGGLVVDPAVTASGSTTQMRVAVSATPRRVLPIPRAIVRVTQTVTGAKERYTVPGRAS